MSNLHNNARICVYSREQIVLRHKQGQSAVQRVEAFGISVRTVHKLLRRYQEEGAGDLLNRSRTPVCSPHIYVMGWRDLIEKLRS